MATSPKHEESAAGRAAAPETNQNPTGRPEPQERSHGGLIFWGILAAAVLLLCAVWLFRPPRAETRGTLAALSLEPVSSKGTPVTLADLSGKVVLLNFWGTWCGECVRELPEMAALEQAYRGSQDVAVCLVSCGQSSSQDEADKIKSVRIHTQSLLEQKFLDSPAYLDPDQKTRQAIREFADYETLGLRTFPTAVLLDRQHRLHKCWVGGVHQADLEAEIEKLRRE